MSGEKENKWKHSCEMFSQVVLFLCLPKKKKFVMKTPDAHTEKGI